ncbi:hypothetical protein EVA_09673 [gut metagenome]|uniref:FimV N-terminal domain-containing protein n=1 Tax=gut metagenome TaxID=749906 RepID=J9CQ13_9ZZZZ
MRYDDRQCFCSDRRDAFFPIGTVYGIQMLKKKLSASLTALALASLAAQSGATALGDLQVESRIGEPFEAKISLIDVDPSAVPLRVRVAPPFVYEEQKTGFRRDLRPEG